MTPAARVSVAAALPHARARITRPVALSWAPVLAGAAMGAVTIVVGLKLGARLGSASAPFYLWWDPRIGWGLAAVVLVFAAGVRTATALTVARVRATQFAALAFLLGLLLRLALGAMRGGPASWWAVFGNAYEARNEYLPALPAFRLGTRTFLDRFAELSPSLPIHPSAHPPGLLLTLHGLGITTAPAMAALTILVGALIVPLTYLLARPLLSERDARVAALLCAFAPASLLYGVTSADALFATVALLPAVALLNARRVVRATGPPLVAVASFFSYPLPGLAAFSILMTARRRSTGAAVRLAIACGLGTGAAYLGLYVLTGFDLIGTLHAAGGTYRRSIASQRPYEFWLFGSPTAFLVAVGLPLSFLLLRGAGRREPAALATLAVIAACALLGFTKAETERIWQFLIPCVCVAAAAALRRRPQWVLVALSLQAVAVEAAFDTRW